MAFNSMKTDINVRNPRCSFWHQSQQNGFEKVTLMILNSKPCSIKWVHDSHIIYNEDCWVTFVQSQCLLSKEMIKNSMKIMMFFALKIG